MKRECPQCGDRINKDSCPACGWREQTQEAKPRDPLWWCCQDVYRGQRCSRPGSFSHNTVGPHKWLCWEHAYPEFARAVRENVPAIRAPRPISDVIDDVEFSRE